MSSPQYGRLDSESSSSSPRRRYHGHGASKSLADAENSPLLAGPSTPVERHSSDSLEGAFGAANSRIRRDNGHTLAYLPSTYHSSDESYFLSFIMEKLQPTKLAYFLDKIAVDSEPGLTTAQLMLNNHDLKPVEAERRTWSHLNFVTFWYVRVLTSNVP